MIESNVIELYGDYRNQAAPKAVMKIQFYLLKASDTGDAPIIVFGKTYESEKQEIPGHVESSVDAEIEEMQSALIACRQIYDDLRTKSLNGLHLKLRSLEVEQK